ncbi:hypothetical protein [Streptomyces yangpuensis]|uniref:hypothetical protein n=1 Tax=Streptomyces yangpuensis TaxID=1648182 RepID=UPI00365CFB25
MKFNQRAAAATILAVAATGMLTSCAGTAPSAPPAKPVAGDRPLVDRAKWPEATPGRGLAQGLTLPLETYMQTYQETVVLDGAVRQLQEECMADYGLPVRLPVEGTNPPPSDNDANMERRYGLTDREAAAAHGYGLPDEATEPVRQKVPELEPAEFEVLTGRKLPAAAAAGGAPPGRPGAPRRGTEQENHQRGGPPRGGGGRAGRGRPRRPRARPARAPRPPATRTTARSCTRAAARTGRPGRSRSPARTT